MIITKIEFGRKDLITITKEETQHNGYIHKQVIFKMSLPWNKS